MSRLLFFKMLPILRYGVFRAHISELAAFKKKVIWTFYSEAYSEHFLSLKLRLKVPVEMMHRPSSFQGVFWLIKYCIWPHNKAVWFKIKKFLQEINSTHILSNFYTQDFLCRIILLVLWLWVSGFRSCHSDAACDMCHALVVLPIPSTDRPIYKCWIRWGSIQFLQGRIAASVGRVT